MPQKMNRSQMQNYIPKGNGDPSGEYADDEGGNIHIQFKQFKKPSKQDIDLKPSEETKPKDQPKEKPKANNDQNGKEAFKIGNIQNEVKYLAFSFGDGWTTVDESKYEKAKTQLGESYAKKVEFKTLGEEEGNKVIDEVKSRILDTAKNKDISKMANYYQYGTSQLESILKYNGFSDNDILVFANKSNFYDFINDEGLKEELYKNANGITKEWMTSKFPKLKTKLSHEQMVDSCNPKYNPLQMRGGLYNRNCQRCPFVYELRMRGYDVQAKGLKRGDTFDRSGIWETQMKFKEIDDFKHSHSSIDLKRDIEQKILNAGNGARYAVRVRWWNGGGHLFTAENINGEVKFFDTQTHNLDCSDYFGRANVSDTKIYRMDNAEFMPGVINTTTIGA